MHIALTIVRKKEYPSEFFAGESVERQKGKVVMQLVLAGLAIGGVVLVLQSTSRFGPGLTSDSACYLSAAKGLLSGKGFLCFDGSPLVGWPPLFPTLLAIPGLVGISPVDSARFLNAFAFGLVIFFSGQMFLQSLRIKVLAVLGAVSVLLSFSVLRACVMVWTEPVFCLLVVLFIMQLSCFLNKRKAAAFVLVCVLAAFLCSQRYIGGAFVLAGAGLLIVLMPKKRLVRRLSYAGIFLLASVIPVLLWFMRNYRLTSTLAGNRPAPSFTLGQNAVATSEILASWFLPERVVGSWVGVVLTGLAIAGIIIFLFYRFKGRTNIRPINLRCAMAIVLVYILSLLAIATRESIGTFERLLAPAFVPVMLLVLGTVEKMAMGLGRRLRKESIAKWIAVGVWALLLVYPFSHIIKAHRYWLQNGVGVYDTVEWQKSPLIGWLKAHPLTGRVFSNAPAAIYLLTGSEARMSPRRTDDISQLIESGMVRKGDYLVWFRRIRRPYLFNVPELADIFSLEEIAFVGDGGVMVFR